MKKLPDNHIDITITSPPYNKTNRTMKRRVAVRYRDFKDNLHMEDYRDNQIAVMDELYRITKPGGHCFYVHKVQYVNKECEHPITWLTKTLWNIREEILWLKNESGYNVNPYRFITKDIRIYWLYKPDPDVVFNLDSNVNTWSNVWFLPNDLSLKHRFGKFDHPSTFPLFLVLSILHALKPSKKAIIFDPYLGSGTTAKAAQMLGLNYMGCDIDSYYVKMAKDRLKETCPFDKFCFQIFQKMLSEGNLDLSKPCKFKDFFEEPISKKQKKM